MIRLMTLSAVAALALAPAAFAQDGVRVSLTGKSSEQIHTDIVSAARKVCSKAVTGETMILDAYGRCMKGSVNTALEKLGDPEVAKLEQLRLAQRWL